MKLLMQVANGWLSAGYQSATSGVSLYKLTFTITTMFSQRQAYSMSTHARDGAGAGKHRPGDRLRSYSTRYFTDVLNSLLRCFYTMERNTRRLRSKNEDEAIAVVAVVPSVWVRNSWTLNVLFRSLIQTNTQTHRQISRQAARQSDRQIPIDESNGKARIDKYGLY